jgi:hypothetical protein
VSDVAHWIDEVWRNNTTLAAAGTAASLDGDRAHHANDVTSLAPDDVGATALSRHQRRKGCASS